MTPISPLGPGKHTHQQIHENGMEKDLSIEGQSLQSVEGQSFSISPNALSIQQ
jgi:hypothetical protein